MTDRLTDTRRAYERADAAAKRRREELAEVIAEAIRSGMRISDVARATGYDREHIRRIARAHGIEAAPRKVPSQSDRAAS